MNTKTLIAAAAIALVGTTAFASDVRDVPAPSTLTRAEVIADLQRAQASADPLIQTDAYGTVSPNLDALAATRTARAPRGQEAPRQRVGFPNAATIVGESYGSVEPGLSARSRESVRAEAVVALRGGQARSAYAGD